MSAAVVTIVMPALNEEDHIAAAIASILPADPGLAYELFVVDGGSRDRTGEIVTEIAGANGRIRLLHNDKRIQSAAVNLGAREAHPQSRHLVRADCHARYPAGFVSRCIETLVEKDVASVVVPMQTVGRTCMQRAIAAAQNSRMGNGGSRHRLAGSSGFVDHGHHAAFDKAVFLEFGGYNEDVPYNEDAELDLRLTRGGKRIYLDGRAGIEYFPRAHLGSLARQYFRYGWGTANTFLVHKAPLKLRRVLPVALLFGCALAVPFAAFDLRALAFPALYAVLACGWGLAIAIAQRDACALMSGPAAMVMHLSWGLGFVRRLLPSNS
jgi:succinoglycan biosynthesis protein ExoA